MSEDPWKDDRLGYRDIGTAFTNLVKSINDGKVISIEAGFGRGKTFFREAWAKHLRQEGEVVVELDVQRSDHSGDPVVTLLGALVSELPENEQNKTKAVMESAKKLAAVGAKTIGRAVLKAGADELIDYLTENAIDELGEYDKLADAITNLGGEMSKVAGQLIASQMAAEKVRSEELPQQLKTLRTALTGGNDEGRVVILIDELDRCHPEYAIAFLEAMKLIFAESGFVFVLMVNAEYLENLAKHRFGLQDGEEKYLDKFVDLRLRLEPKNDHKEAAVRELASMLPLSIPFGNSDAFSVEHAASLAGKIAVEYNFSMRKSKRVLLRVEYALRCYSNQPLDASLLVFLAFQSEMSVSLKSDLLPRSFLTPTVGKNNSQPPEPRRSLETPSEIRAYDSKKNQSIQEIAPELLELPEDRYRAPAPPNGERYKPWALVYFYLASHYIPFHEEILNSVAAITVEET